MLFVLILNRYYSGVSVIDVHPNSGNYLGGTTLLWNGTGFFQSAYLTCRFSFDSYVVTSPASFISSTEASCLSPAITRENSSIFTFRFFRL